MDMFDEINTDVADANLRAMRPGDVWVVSFDGAAHDVGSITAGDAFCYVVGWTVAVCGSRVEFMGHARPGRPTCSGCVEMRTPVPLNVVALARAERFIHLRAKDEHLRRPILLDGQVVGFCHPHETPRGFRLGPIFVLPEHRGRGLTRAAYERHAAGKRCVAYIHDGNVGSEKAHAAAGFVKWRQGRGGWTWVREVSP